MRTGGLEFQFFFKSQLLCSLTIFGKSCFTNSWRPTGEESDALGFSSVLVVAPPHFRCRVDGSCSLLQNATPVWHDPAKVPNACFALVLTDLRVAPQLFSQKVVHFHCPVRAADDFQLVQEREPTRNLAATAINAACCPRLNNMGINGSPCSPPSP